MGKIGFALVALGMSMADSDCLIVPLVVIVLGFFILWRNGYVE